MEASRPYPELVYEVWSIDAGRVRNVFELTKTRCAAVLKGGAGIEALKELRIEASNEYLDLSNTVREIERRVRLRLHVRLGNREVRTPPAPYRAMTVFLAPPSLFEPDIFSAGNPLMRLIHGNGYPPAHIPVMRDGYPEDEPPPCDTSATVDEWLARHQTGLYGFGEICDWLFRSGTMASAAWHALEAFRYSEGDWFESLIDELGTEDPYGVIPFMSAQPLLGLHDTDALSQLSEAPKLPLNGETGHGLQVGQTVGPDGTVDGYAENPLAGATDHMKGLFREALRWYRSGGRWPEGGHYPKMNDWPGFGEGKSDVTDTLRDKFNERLGAWAYPRIDKWQTKHMNEAMDRLERALERE